MMVLQVYITCLLCLHFCVGGSILAVLLAGYLAQHYLPPPKPKVIGIDLGKQYHQNLLSRVEKNIVIRFVYWCNMSYFQKFSYSKFCEVIAYVCYMQFKIFVFLLLKLLSFV